MKKTIGILLTLLLMSLLVACGGGSSDEGESAGDFDPANIKTLGDVFEYVDWEGNYQDGYSETKYAIAFEIDGVNYRAIADLPKEVSDEIWAIDFEDADRDQKIRELLSPLEVAKFENLTEQIPPQEELDKWVGKTGQELFDAGWTNWYYDLEEMKAGMYYGPFSYEVVFNYDGPQLENTDDFDFEANFKDLTVKSVTYEGLGDAANVE